MSYRKRYGQRNYYASFQEHNGDQDTHGTPTYGDAADWITVVPQFPAELVSTTGGEVLRGRQISAITTHVLYGEYYSGEGIKPNHRCVIDGKLYEVVSVLDMDGRHRELRVELKQAE